MIKPFLSAWDGGDVHLSSWEPASNEEVHLHVGLFVGALRDQREETFTVLIATPEGLRAHGTPPVLSERATLVVDAFNSWQIREEVDRIVKSCAAPTWSEVIAMLQRYFRWEHEWRVDSPQT